MCQPPHGKWGLVSNLCHVSVFATSSVQHRVAIALIRANKGDGIVQLLSVCVCGLGVVRRSVNSSGTMCD